MRRESGRSYQSPARQRQADETKQRIADAAQRLLLAHGYAGMTIDAIAKEAEVAAQTVYAVFRSKRGILAELLDRATMGASHEERVRQVAGTTDPEERLKLVARIARNVFESESAMMDLLRGAGVVAPELAALETERECRRYEAQQSNIALLIDAGRLKPGLDREEARGVLWTLTSRDIYRMLTRERSWTPERYEAWLAEMLAAALLS
jgi:AcrR family transcriptional regulator